MTEVSTIVVGAGPAGLAVAACLKREGLPFIQLEQARRVGSTWRQHYDRLHLHTSKGTSALPFVPFPRTYPRYPSRDQVVDYLERYARHFGLQPRFDQQVYRAWRTAGGWTVQTQGARYRTEHLVIATGYTREPVVPRWPGQSSFEGEVLHSSRYQSGEPFRDRKALVVGFGNSGGEIAIDLCEHGADCSISVRSPVNVIPRDLFGIPIVNLAIAARWLPSRLADALMAPLLRLAVGDLSRYGLTKRSYGPVEQIRRDMRIPLIDVGTVRRIREGQIGVYPGIRRFTRNGVVFTDGRVAAFDIVVLATGYRPRVNAFLDAPAAYDEHGTPVSSGCETAPGLYFCGFHVAPSGVLRAIRREAKRVAAQIGS